MFCFCKVQFLYRFDEFFSPMCFLCPQKITVTDIKNFERQYRHSPEELSDLKQAYLDGDGDMDFILDSVPCCSLDDQERFADLLLDLVEKEELPFFKKFRKLTAKQVKLRKRKAGKEVEEAEEMAK